jgi:uncharacterized repeat protein (TIGR04138 family)
MQHLNFEDVLQRIANQDSRYRREAYLFLREALDYTQKRLNQTKKDEPRHVTGQELLAGIREYALSQFGPMSKTVLNEWGLNSCADFGEMVFNMVDHGLLSKTDSDSRDDFKSGFDFDQAFCEPFRPRTREGVTPPPETPASQP